MDLKELYHDLIRYETELWNAIDARLTAECGIPLTWLEILRMLERTGGCRVQDMAREFAITVGGISKVVDRIEAAGHCARRPNPDDGRSSLVELTPAGQELLGRAVQLFEDELDLRIGSVLPRRAQQQLADTLRTLRAASRSGAHRR
ncbi:MarR family winged helix-turn-helix transcriptional regulator [Streptomyces sp. NPDC050418]|uniref:MarR family winged helix-turn-helix transcriptional regulator n=1 Tax=Streptomyces sp. NPDC050418 TaxID=3365612 RepID=UPI0037A1BB0B